MARVKIGLDAGHGLKTAGKQTPDGIKEWTLNDKVRDKVVKILSEYDCEIIHTDNNEGNVDESLADRVAKYKNAGVDVFVSIHHNALNGKWNSATGVEVFVDKNPTGKDLELATCVYNRLVKYTGMKGRGIKEYNFWVINQDTIPAILVEGGFMDGRKDYKYITSDAGQTAYAKAVAEGLIVFCKLNKKPAKNKPTTATTTKTSTIKKGNLVSIKSGAKYYDGKSIPSWVLKLKWNVAEIVGNRAVLGKSEDGKYSINSPIDVKYLSVVAKSATPTIKVGSTVKLNKGAKTYDGKTLSSFVYGRKHKVKELNGNRAVITYLGITVAAVNVKDLTLV